MVKRNVFNPTLGIRPGGFPSKVFMKAFYDRPFVGARADFYQKRTCKKCDNPNGSASPSPLRPLTRRSRVWNRHSAYRPHAFKRSVDWQNIFPEPTGFSTSYSLSPRIEPSGAAPGYSPPPNSLHGDGKRPDRQALIRLVPGNPLCG